MYNICMKTYYEPSELQRLVKALKLDQSELAKAVGVTQGQVSRLIAGKFKKPGTAYMKLCTHVSNALGKNSRIDNMHTQIIMEAVADIWDGSIEQANHLAEVIRSLGPLCLKGFEC